MKKKVKIKTWDEMESEFGVDCDGNIDCTYIFTPSMEKLLPENRIIEIRVFGEGEPARWKYGRGTDRGNISSDMIAEDLTPIYSIKEYGAGAFLLKNGKQIADFESHIEAEKVLNLIRS